MEWLDAMKVHLLDLDREVSDHGIRLILGGGYGLYLEQQYLQSREIETVLAMEIWPAPRATSDLDVFLTAEVVTNSDSMGKIRSALDALGYLETKSAQFYQFVRRIDNGQQVKLDLLVGPLGEYETRVRKDSRRVRPRPSARLHAHPFDEALAVEESCMEIKLFGQLSSGEPHRTTIFVPQPFSYLLMKLFAFRDRKDDEDKDLGRHHALDVLRVVAMMTKREYEETQRLVGVHAGEAPVQQAREIVRDCFSDEDAIGMIRMREHPSFREEIDIEDFLGYLHGLFEE